MKKILYLLMFISVAAMGQHTQLGSIGATDLFYVVHSGSLKIVRADSMALFFSATPSWQATLGVDNTTTASAYWNSGAVASFDNDNASAVVFYSSTTGNSSRIRAVTPRVNSHVFLLADTGGIIPMSVNGTFADSSGNIAIGGGSTPSLQSVVDVGNSINSSSSIIFQNGGDLIHGCDFYNQDNGSHIILSANQYQQLSIYNSVSGAAAAFDFTNTSSMTSGLFQWPSGNFSAVMAVSVAGVQAGTNGDISLTAANIGALAVSDTVSLIATQFDVANANTSTFQYATPTTGQTVTANGAKYLVINPSGSLLALTIAFPSSPTNGQLFSISSTQVVTTLTLTSSGTVDGTLTGIAANGTAGWIWVATISSWVKVHN